MLNRIIALIYSLLMLSQGMVAGYVAETRLGGNLFLANRQYRLSVDYEPTDLVELKLKSANPGQRLRKEAAQKLAELFAQAEKEGIQLVVVSGYRSYFSQKNIFSRRVRRAKGNVSEAKKSVAPPGTSEHQLGLACDVGKKQGNSLVSSFGTTKEGIWLKNNAHRFGFIIRFQKEWEQVTGYMYEPWHIRYVGVEHAKIMYERQIPLEYYVFALKQALHGDLTLDEEKNAEALRLVTGGKAEGKNDESASKGADKTNSGGENAESPVSDALQGDEFTTEGSQEGSYIVSQDDKNSDKNTEDSDADAKKNERK